MILVYTYCVSKRLKEKTEIALQQRGGPDGHRRMDIRTLFDLSLFELANNPRFNLCSAYEQFLDLFDGERRTDVADKFLDKFLALQVQRRLVWRSTGPICRFALSRRPSVTYYGTYVRRATACGRRAIRRANK